MKTKPLVFSSSIVCFLLLSSFDSSIYFNERIQDEFTYKISIKKFKDEFGNVDEIFTIIKLEKL